MFSSFLSSCFVLFFLPCLLAYLLLARAKARAEAERSRLLAAQQEAALKGLPLAQPPAAASLLRQVGGALLVAGAKAAAGQAFGDPRHPKRHDG